MLSGDWIYRSYRNEATLVSGDPQTALRLIFGEGVMRLNQGASGYLSGTFDMGGGYMLDLVGSSLGHAGSGPPGFEFSGKGRDGTPTEGWQYDYRGAENHAWPDGEGQVPTLVGTVIRSKPHGGAPAGYSASFICILRS